jgi:hypothetical protein
VNLPLQTMNATAGLLQRCMIVGTQGLIPFRLEGFDAGFDRSLIDSDYFVMLVNVDVQRFAHRDDQVFFIELRIALQSFVIDVFRDVAQFRKRFML